MRMFAKTKIAQQTHSIIKKRMAIIIMIICDRKLTLKNYNTPNGATLLGGTGLYLLWAIMFAWLILLAAGGSSAFIYFQF